jgi:transcriptional regulator with XRE-family HTH domain
MHLTQDAVADFLGIARVTYTLYEGDKKEFSIELLEKLSNLFGIGLDELFEENESVIHANVAFAFRADEVKVEDLTSIAEFRKVIKNYFKLVDLEKKI